MPQRARSLLFCQAVLIVAKQGGWWRGAPLAATTLLQAQDILKQAWCGQLEPGAFAGLAAPLKVPGVAGKQQSALASVRGMYAVAMQLLDTQPVHAVLKFLLLASGCIDLAKKEEVGRPMQPCAHMACGLAWRGQRRERCKPCSGWSLQRQRRLLWCACRSRSLRS